VAGNWCEIDAIKFIGHTSVNHLAIQELISNLKQLLTNDELGDVTFELDDGRTVVTYGNILRNRSIYFDQLFREHSANNHQPIRMKNITYEAFHQILHFIYTDSIEPILTYEICLELMRKADEFYLSAIYVDAFDILKTTVINKGNVLKIFTQSGLFVDSSNDAGLNSIILPDVIELCVDFIRKNRADVYCSEYMQHLTKDMLLRLVQLVQ
jgi:hypothetical protein